MELENLFGEDHKNLTRMRIHIIFRKELFFILMLFITLCFLLGFIATEILRSRTLSIIVVIILISPLLVMKLLLRKFTHQMIILLGTDWFNTTVFNHRGDDIQRQVYLRDIRSYCIQVPNEKFKSIKFKMRDNSTIEYSFFQSKKDDADITADELINSFHMIIQKYNAESKVKIRLNPSFYATNAGLIFIVGLGVLFMVGFYIATLSKTKAMPTALIFGFILLMQLILKRKKEAAYFKKMTN